jgi:hypothetical protein
MRKFALLSLLAVSFALLAGCGNPPQEKTASAEVTGAETTSKVAITIKPSDKVPAPGEESSAWTVENADMTQEDVTSLNIYLVSLGDKGASGPLIGCDDSLVAVKVKYSPARDEQSAKEALAMLFAVKDQYYGSSGLYNALYNSDLKVDSLTADKDKKSTLKLSGTYTLGGVCDNPRFEEQIRGTVLQFKDLYNDVEIFINDKPLKELMSMKG